MLINVINSKFCTGYLLHPFQLPSRFFHWLHPESSNAFFSASNKIIPLTSTRLFKCIFFSFRSDSSTDFHQTLSLTLKWQKVSKKMIPVHFWLGCRSWMRSHGLQVSISLNSEKSKEFLKQKIVHKSEFFIVLLALYLNTVYNFEMVPIWLMRKTPV